MAPQLLTEALRAAHVRTGPDGRACPCCVRLTARDAARLRRAQRRREARAFRAAAAEDRS